MLDIKVLGKAALESSDMDDSYEEVVVFEVEGEVVFEEELLDAVDAEFQYGCSCAHDCCGHFFCQVWTHTLTPMNGRENVYTVVISNQRNV